jgi:hypothetical protein
MAALRDVKKTEEVWMVNAIDIEQMINVSVAEPALPPIRPRETEVFLNELAPAGEAL